jgi:glycosyltransferase involved in cell wall biosynthesis
VITLCIPSRDETMLDETIASGFAAGADEVVVIDDGSKKPVKQSTDTRIKIHRVSTSRGPSYARNLAGKLATGDIIIYSDAHVKFPAGGLTKIAELAKEKDTIVQACTRAMDGTRDWTGYGGIIQDIGPGVDIVYNKDPEQSATGYIGSVYGGTRACWDAIGWWPHTSGWGYNEQALTLAVLYSGRMPFVAPVICEHQFKKSFNYPVDPVKTRINRLLVHFQCCENFWERWFPPIQKNFGSISAKFQNMLHDFPEWQKLRTDRLSIRKITDDQLEEILQSGRRMTTMRAERNADAPKTSPTVCVFTPFSRGREHNLSRWLHCVEKSGEKISGYVFALDNNRQDVVTLAKRLNAKIINLPALPENHTSAELSTHLANAWNLALPELRKFDYVLSLEDDVFPADGFLSKLLLSATSTPVIAAAGVAVKSRHGNYRMAYRAKSLEPFVLNLVPLLDHRTAAIDSISTSCTLIRLNSIDENFHLTGQPNVSNDQPSGPYGHEFSLMKHLRIRNYGIVADWTIDCEHQSEIGKNKSYIDPVRKENFIKSRRCQKRHECYNCRTSLEFRNKIREEYLVPMDFDTHCPNGLIAKRLKPEKTVDCGCNTPLY